MTKNTPGANILICGSQKFDDESFVFGMLDNYFLNSNGKIKKIFTSEFSGACEIARQWVAKTNDNLMSIAKEHHLKEVPQIESGDCTFDMLLMERNASLYEQLDIPDFLLQNDPFYIKGSKLISDNKIDVVMAFPNPQGILGPATYNINRFARLAGIGDYILDCSDALKELVIVRNRMKEDMQNNMIQKPASTGFVNKHPGKKF